MDPVTDTLREIIAHVASHPGAEIFSADDPRRLRVGFRCACGREWGFTLVQLKESRIPLPLLQGRFAAAAGRELLARELSDGSFSL